MDKFKFLLSIIIVFRNDEACIKQLLTEISNFIATFWREYELIIIDNASQDNSLKILEELTNEHGLANLQVYALTKQVDIDAAAWVGIENALGDYVVIIDPLMDDIEFLPSMLDQIKQGTDIVFAENKLKPKQNFSYRFFSAIFNLLYKWFNKIHLSKEVPPYKILSKRVINFILQHKLPLLTYRHLLVSSGFKRVYLTYAAQPKIYRRRRLSGNIDRGIKMVVSTTQGPLRLVTFFAFFGAVFNFLYSGYVIAILLLKSNVAPGWATLSLQLSGMFFLFSIVLLVLAEYILHMLTLSHVEPQYHVAQELTSVVMTKYQKLNIEENSLS